MLEELVQWISSDESVSLSPSGYRQYLAMLRENSEFKSLRSRHPAFYKEVYGLRSQQPSVRTLLNLAALQGVTILDILLRPKESASQPLFDRASDFEGIPFPSVTLTVAASRVERIVSALQDGVDTLIPPLHIICQLEELQSFEYCRSFESSSLAYRRRYDRQKEIKTVGSWTFKREFQAALHHVQRSDGRVSEARAIRKMKARGFLKDDLIERMAITAAKIIRIRSSMVPD